MYIPYVKYLYIFCYAFILTVFSTASVAQVKRQSIEASSEKGQLQDLICIEDRWIDSWYCNFSKAVGTTVEAVNQWFVVKQSDPTLPSKASGYVRFGLEPRSGDLAGVDFRFKLRVKLPALENRVDLLLSDDEDGDRPNQIKSIRNGDLRSEQQATIALQFKQAEDSKVSYRLGIGRSTQIYLRAKYENNWLLNNKNQIEYSAEANYYTRDRLGAEIDVNYIHMLSNVSTLSWYNHYNFRDDADNWFWRHELEYYRQFRNNVSLTAVILFQGLNQPSYNVEQQLFSVRYKRPVLREWFFVEIEPYIIKLREENFRTSYGLSLRAEVHFGQY